MIRCAIILALFFLAGCSDKYTPRLLTKSFSIDRTPAVPDYSKAENWAALPDRSDEADHVPSCAGCRDEQSTAAVDVFFIHPTLYLDTTAEDNQWNADVADAALNNKVDESTIFYQASVFNGAAKIYAPRYRQAHITVYHTQDHATADLALDLAYSDVRKAFLYYMEHWNKNRPVIIASHSQGTTHAVRLLQEFFDGKELSKQMVAAYLIGIPVYDTLFKQLQICHDSSSTGCFVTWRTFAAKYFPEGYLRPKHDAVCTNPLTWKTDSIYAPASLNKGGILKNFNRVIPGLCDAQVLDGVVRINRPHFFFSPFFKYNNYHIVDYNLFYLNIKENVQLRVKSFLEMKSQSLR